MTRIVERDSETDAELRRTTFTYNADKTVATKTYSDPRQTYVPSYEDDPDHLGRMPAPTIDILREVGARRRSK